jgi:uncharacterized protein (DUF983 family)
MAMFDWYRLKVQHECSECGNPLAEWQGYDGPNGLFVWEEGIVCAVDQTASEDCKLPPEKRERWRLPESFVIYSYDCLAHHPIYATCKTSAEAWSETLIMPFGWKP